MKKWKTAVFNPGDKPTKIASDLNSLFDDGYELDSTANLSSDKVLFFLTKETSDSDVDGLYDTLSNSGIVNVSSDKEYEEYNYLFVYANDKSAKKDAEYSLENLRNIDGLEPSLLSTKTSPYNVTTLEFDRIFNIYTTRKYTFVSVESLANSPYFDGFKFDGVEIKPEVVEKFEEYESDFYKAIKRIEVMRMTMAHN